MSGKRLSPEQMMGMLWEAKVSLVQGGRWAGLSFPGPCGADLLSPAAGIQYGEAPLLLGCKNQRK